MLRTAPENDEYHFNQFYCYRRLDYTIGLADGDCLGAQLDCLGRLSR